MGCYIGKAIWLGTSYVYLIGKYRTFNIWSSSFVSCSRNRERGKDVRGENGQGLRIWTTGVRKKLVLFMLYTLQGTTKEYCVNTKLCRRYSTILPILCSWIQISSNAVLKSSLLRWSHLNPLSHKVASYRICRLQFLRISHLLNACHMSRPSHTCLNGQAADIK